MAFQYVTLLLIMLLLLFYSGKLLQNKCHIFTFGGYLAIVAYVLNEGLRFGRGLDYNLYALSYENLIAGKESNWDIGFLYIATTLIEIGVPWQGYVILMSFVFIFSVLILLKHYQESLPYVLPLFVLISLHEVENMVRWYMGVSFIYIGVSFLLRKSKHSLFLFILLSGLACTFHLGVAILPIIFYLVEKIRKPIFSPIVTILFFFGISFLFQADFMLQFVQLANMLSDVSERFENYGNEAEYWLTGGFAGVEAYSTLPDVQELLILGCLVFLGYKSSKVSGSKYIYAYNLFVIGLLLHPIARKIELVGRFSQPFYFFRAIVLANIICVIYKEKKLEVAPILLTFSILVFMNMGRRYITGPFKDNPEHYLYIWNSNGKSYESMYDSWLYDIPQSKKK